AVLSWGMPHDTIAILDFGGQYVHLIATKIRGLGVHAEIRDPDDPVDSFRPYKGLILSGSPALSAQDQGAGWSRGVLDLGLPVLGFCYGHQEIAKHAGGTIQHTRQKFGAARLHIVHPSPLLEGLQEEELVWMSHGDTVTNLPGDFIELGFSNGSGENSRRHPNAAIARPERQLYGLQFHPEVDDTPCGLKILRNFVLGICGATPGWSVGDQVQERIDTIRKQVGDQSVFLMVSGGVDSTVCARLFQRALGPQRLKLLHIDNGLMRKNESAAVVQQFERMGLGASFHHVDASEDFLAALDGLTDPEAKRKAIGEAFVAVFQREATKIGLDRVLLAQGTIYPDTIETGGTRRADVIKTHHNRVPLIQAMIKAGQVVEPLQDLYKSEVRELGQALHLDTADLERHPFPGPGLGIRVAAASLVPDDDSHASLTKSLLQALDGTGLSGLPLPVRSVGVKADLRSYEHPVLLWGQAPPWAELTGIATHLTKTVTGINRCLFTLGGRSFRSAEKVAATVTRARLDLLRELDDMVMSRLKDHQVLRRIWQCPTILVPVRLDGQGSELVVIRPVASCRGMTARPVWPGDACMDSITESLLAFPQVAGVAVDLTSKPPATIEWE
ncbi:MAG: glutamine-hydrolyzing GMP synthase, partial [Acidobacteriota bacterium]